MKAYLNFHILLICASFLFGCCSGSNETVQKLSEVNGKLTDELLMIQQAINAEIGKKPSDYNHGIRDTVNLIYDLYRVTLKEIDEVKTPQNLTNLSSNWKHQFNTLSKVSFNNHKYYPELELALQKEFFKIDVNFALKKSVMDYADRIEGVTARD